MAHVPCKRKSAKATVSTTSKKNCPTFLDDNLDIGFDFRNNPNDSILMGLDSLIAADNTNDVKNLFDFKCRIAPVEAVSTVCTGSLETVLHKN
jgi:hypothetical protein